MEVFRTIVAAVRTIALWYQGGTIDSRVTPWILLILVDGWVECFHLKFQFPCRCCTTGAMRAECVCGSEFAAVQCSYNFNNASRHERGFQKKHV